MKSYSVVLDDVQADQLRELVRLNKMAVYNLLPEAERGRYDRLKADVFSYASSVLAAGVTADDEKRGVSP